MHVGSGPGRLAAMSAVVLALAGTGAGSALADTPAAATSPAPDTHQCGHGLHPKQQPVGSGANTHGCGHGLHRGEHRHGGGA